MALCMAFRNLHHLVHIFDTHAPSSSIQTSNITQHSAQTWPICRFNIMQHCSINVGLIWTLSQKINRSRNVTGRPPFVPPSNRLSPSLFMWKSADWPRSRPTSSYFQVQAYFELINFGKCMSTRHAIYRASNRPINSEMLISNNILMNKKFHTNFVQILFSKLKQSKAVLIRFILRSISASSIISATHTVIYGG
jgi:hypothetical protein